MKKNIVLRGIIGFPIGITIGYLISIFTSLIWADGYYSPCVPELIDVMGNEINAVLLQALLCGLVGVGFSGGSVIWEVERWGIVVQTGVYFAVTALIMMPIAYFMYWMEHSLRGFLSYLGIFVLIFAVVWIVQYMIGRYIVKKLNTNLQKTKGGSQ